MSDSSSDDELFDIRAVGRAPSGPPKPPGQSSSSKSKPAPSDDESSSDELMDIRAMGKAPSGPPKPPSSSQQTRHFIDDDSSSESEDDAEKAKQAALERYRQEEEAEKQRELAKKEKHAAKIAAEEIEKQSQIKDDFDDSDMKSPPSKGSVSGAAPVLKKGQQPPNDLQATLKDKKFKEKIKGYSTRFSAGYADTIGKRPTMEDKLVIFGQFNNQSDQEYFAIFDGHGGTASSAYAGKHLHKHLIKSLGDKSDSLSDDDVSKALIKSFENCQECIAKEDIEAGTTALVAYIRKNQLFIANLGDARAVLITKDEKGERASYDHKPHDPIEEARVVKAGGHVTKSVHKGVVTARVNGMLAVSRSLGDNSLRAYLSCTPQIHGPFDTTKYEGLVLGCDGVWDVVSDNTAARLAFEQLKKDNNVEQAAINIRNKAYTRESRDNISVIVINFNQ